MKGKYFSGTVLKKDITRFAPIWALYTVFMLLFLFFAWDSGRNELATNAPYIMQLMGVVNLAYAGIVAVMLFGDLFQSRMCNALHAMPLRREGWFLTHMTAGLLFSIGPSLLGAVLAGMLLERLAFLAYVWLAMVVLSYVFFFGVAVFSCLCAGNRLGAAAIYAIINFLAVVVTFFVQTFYEPLLYGVELDASKYYSLSPVVAMSQSSYVNIDWDSVSREAIFQGFYPSHWQHLYITFAVGVVFLVLAVLIYRKRQLESAGDFVAVKPAAPIFLVVYSLCVGAVLYLIADELTGESAKYLFLLIGMAIGFFTGQMLLNRRVNVFSTRILLQFCVLTVAFALSLSITAVDPIGVSRYVPKTEDVQQVSIRPYEYWSFRDTNDTISLSEPEDVEEITQMHREIALRQPSATDMIVHIKYTLTSGKEVSRKYTIGIDSTWAETLKPYYSSPECVFGTQDIDKMLENTMSVECWNYEETIPYVGVVLKNSSQEQYFSEKEAKVEVSQKAFSLLTENRFNKEPVITGLVEAIKKDCAEGDMAQVWNYHQSEQEIGYLAFDYYNEDGEEVRQTITVFSGCKNTIAYLQSLPAE